MKLSALFDSTIFAVVGASQDEHKVGHQIFQNLKNNLDFITYPINPKKGKILGSTVYAKLQDTPKVPQVVIIAVPVAAVESIIDDCIRQHVLAVVLITAGFAEEGTSGAILQSKIIAKLDQAGIALLGPNTMGYVVPSKKLYASFGPKQLSSGPIAVISQSGAMLSALFQEYDSAQTGVSFAISLGNRTGISENEALEYATSDPNTQGIVIYLESIADPIKLLAIAQKCSSQKPIFLLKGGTTTEGSRAAVSHTAALATSQVLLNALCQQAGITQVDNFEQLVRASIAISQNKPLPNSVAIVTNAGGPAVVLTDEISKLGIPLTSLGKDTKNPLDLLGDASVETYSQAIKSLLTNPTVDTLAIVATEQAVTDIFAITNLLLELPRNKLLFVCLAGGDQLDIYRSKLSQAGIVTTRYPNDLADTIGALYRANKQLNKPTQKATIATSQSNTFPDSYKSLETLLSKYQILMPKQQIVSTESELSCVSKLTFPLIAKTTNLALKHKAKLGAVIQDIVDLAQAKRAFRQLQQFDHSVVFQQKITKGVQVLLGVHFDSIWGWYMAVGLGGSLSDTYDDRAYIFLPATSMQMTQTIAQTKLPQLLSELAISQLSKAMQHLQECTFATSNLAEIELNPLFVTDHSVIAADIKRS